MYQPKISPNLKKLLEKGEGSNVLIKLFDGRKVSCKFDMLTYANKSDDDDSDVMVASVRYSEEYGELLTEEDILEVY